MVTVTQAKEPDVAANPGLAAMLAEAEREEQGAIAVRTDAAAKAANAESDSMVEDIFDALCMVREFAAPPIEDAGLLPVGKLETIWTDAVLRKIAKPAAQIMQRHGFSLGEILDRWGPYLALIAALATPSMATYNAIRTHVTDAIVKAGDAVQP